MAQIVIVITDPAGNRSEVRVDNYTPVRQALGTFVKHLGLPPQLTYHLYPAGVSAKLSADKTLAAVGVRPGSELTVAPVRDVVFTTLIDRLYAETRDFALHEFWESAGERLGQLLRLDPGHPDPEGFRGSVPVSDAPPIPPPAPKSNVIRSRRPDPPPMRPDVQLPVPATAGKGGCLVVIATAACLALGAVRALSAAP